MEAWKSKKSICILGDFIFTIVLIAFDQFTKKLAIVHLKGQNAFVIWKNIFELDYLENRGSAFGMFQGKKLFLLIVGFVLMAFVGYVMIKIPVGKRFLFLRILFCLLVAGGFGNMIDRILNGYVVDFFSFVLIHFPVFNVADIYIVISAITIGLLFMFYYKEDELSFFYPNALSKQESAKENDESNE